MIVVNWLMPGRGWRPTGTNSTRDGSSRAADVSADLIVGLVMALADQPGMIAADALHRRLGTALDEALYDDPDGRISPHDLAQALITAAGAAVRSTTGQEDASRGPWRVLTAVADMLG
jgi:hypothetical protein